MHFVSKVNILNEASFVENRSKYDVRDLKSGPDGHSSTTSNVFRALSGLAPMKTTSRLNSYLPPSPHVGNYVCFLNEKLSMCFLCVFLTMYFKNIFKH